MWWGQSARRKACTTGLFTVCTCTIAVSMLPLESITSLMKCKNVTDLCNFVRDTLNVYKWSYLRKKSKDGARTDGAHIVNNPKNIPKYTKDYLREFR